MLFYCTSTTNLQWTKGRHSSDIWNARSVLIQKIVIYIPNKKHDIAHELEENPPDKTAKSVQASLEWKSWKSFQNLGVNEYVY